MTKRTKHLGYQTGGSSDRGLSPQRPYTGDGKTKRTIFDKIVVAFQSGKKS